MSVETEMICELWKEETLTAHPPSRLYHLKPIGIGTPLVESLTSYISRLANEHSVLLRTLVTDEILPNLHRSHLYSKGQPIYNHLTTFWKQSATLNGTSATASNWVQTLEQLTLRSDLRLLTMLTFADVLSPMNLMRYTQAWCPNCYEEWRKKGQEIYQPLLWQLAVINTCPQHATPLHLYCPYTNCRRTLSPFASHAQPGYCTHCKQWLGNPSSPETCQATTRCEQEWQHWVGQVVGELLAVASHFSIPPSQEATSAIITAHVYGLMEGNFSELARRIRFHRRTVWEWAQGTQIPQLEALLQICSYFEISPVRLLLGNFHEVTQVQNHSLKKKPIIEQPKRRFRKFETEKLRCALETALQSEEYPPPSMREVARHLKYDQSHLYKHFPNLCRAISMRYQAFREGQRVNRLQSACNEVEQAKQSLYTKNHPLSERQIGKILRKRGILREKEVRLALKSSLHMLR